MEISYYDKENLSKLTEKSQEDIEDILPTVSEILKNVKNSKDLSLIEYTKKFDNVEIESLKVSKDEIKESYLNLKESNPELLNSLEEASENIAKFHKKQIPQEWEIELRKGITAGQIIRPINKVGCYIPGGRAAYPSTILMTVIPAKIAGVENIICCSPPQENGKIMDAILVAADIAGADEIYKVGGAQAIAAMAYGTESIPQVEKIVGPGNIFVTAAKKLVYGNVDIEFPAGPSEVLIIADKTANPEYIAYDILSQAEHDPNASCYLVTDNLKLAKKTKKEIELKTKEAKRKEVIEESLKKFGKIIVTKSIEEAVDISNEYAPEHLIIMTKNNEADEKILKKIKNAGSIFLGKYSPVAAGDYGSGTNHVLPTDRGARMYSGLSTESFLKKPTVQTITQKGLKSLENVVVPIAEYEGFYAHADSIKVRLDKK
ncbi:histidinol dehydrogenase [Methanobrevibacter arboriphilus]|jgi:histidinol dehydrogenase|uniref:Histidinol dehydrogenase n=1 Tax=Methanobrevibacter arboriphilus TaxID=39441 RepID=A0ACA8R1C1_METAZ|nr:histidinol dehydrogenase [Methanobrevibacter arboriphilus]MCC7561997.1 histidinol dehydrogenase [Methanobrevibacter arboriphilus]BBL61406.1 histidinol dehydrogenase [Methanobrevibacter arboriphilus]GLI11261.1 histidinol dehydrogenase [Methanobrevibacter arboriphilus]